LGYTIEEIALLMDRASPTVRRQLAEAEHRIFDVIGVIPHHGLLTKWAREHCSCCMSPCSELAENDQLFSTN
jgi:predicted transcriptional regulator